MIGSICRQGRIAAGKAGNQGGAMAQLFLLTGRYMPSRIERAAISFNAAKGHFAEHDRPSGQDLKTIDPARFIREFVRAEPVEALPFDRLRANGNHV